MTQIVQIFTDYFLYDASGNIANVRTKHQYLSLILEFAFEFATKALPRLAPF